MILDVTNRFSDAQAVTLPIGTYPSSDAVDTFIALGFNPNTLKDLGNGEGLWLTILAPVAIVGVAASTLQARLVTAAIANGATPNILTTPVVIQSGAVIPIGVAGIPAGSILAQFRIPNGFNYQRYLGVEYLVAGAALTGTPTVTSFLSKDIQNAPIYAKNYTIS
jgi:hypothetical protein